MPYFKVLFYFLLHRPNSKLVKMRKTIGGLCEGDIVTYTCKSVNSAGLPVKPTLLRPRHDVTWESVEHDNKYKHYH